MLLSLTCTCGTPYKNTDVSTAAIVACKCAGIENLAPLARARDVDIAVGNSDAVHYVQCIRSRGCNAYVKSGQKEETMAVLFRHSIFSPGQICSPAREKQKSNCIELVLRSILIM